MNVITMLMFCQYCICLYSSSVSHIIHTLQELSATIELREAEFDRESLREAAMTGNTIDQLVRGLQAAEQNLEEAEARKRSATRLLERKVQQLIEEIDNYFDYGLDRDTKEKIVSVYMEIPPGQVYEPDMQEPDRGVLIEYQPDGMSVLLISNPSGKEIVVFTKLKPHDEREDEFIGDYYKSYRHWRLGARADFSSVKAWTEHVRQLHELVMAIVAGSCHSLSPL